MAGRDRQRAAFALGKIEGLEQRNAEDQAKYSTQLLKLPARLHANGLGQTVAFYLSAGPADGAASPEVTICDWLAEWLLKDDSQRGRDLVRHLVSDTACSSQRYRQLSAEARAVSVWLKRFAEAFLGDDPGAAS
jgi:CRISPR type III-B/RAMP module-associated protein Cmr5